MGGAAWCGRIIKFGDHIMLTITPCTSSLPSRFVGDLLLPRLAFDGSPDTFGEIRNLGIPGVGEV